MNANTEVLDITHDMQFGIEAYAKAMLDSIPRTGGVPPVDKLIKIAIRETVPRVIGRTATILAGHQVVASGLTATSPDRCRCGELVSPATGDEEISIRRHRAFAAHQVTVVQEALELGRQEASKL